MRTILTRIGLVALFFGLAAIAYAQGLLTPRVIQTQQADIGAVSATPVWKFSAENVMAKIGEAEALLQDTEVSAGTEKFSYTERRVVTSQSGTYRLEERQSNDVERRVALALLNKETGTLERIVVTTRGNILSVPDGYQIEMAERVSGLQWNGWSTQYRVNAPRDTIVLVVKYPYREKALGPVKPVTYVPFSDELNIGDVVKNAAQYPLSVVQSARDDLAAKGVRSRAIPNKLVTDVIPADFVVPLPFLEQTDLGEMFLIFDDAVERVLGNLAYNGPKAYMLTCNGMGACGWVQFTNNSKGRNLGTYSAIVSRYPQAKLIKDFKKGAADHLNSMEAAILLYDNNLEYFARKLGKNIVSHPRLKELLAAAYNGGPERAVQAFLKAQKQGTGTKDSWVDGLLRETRGFIAKLRQLEDNNVPGRYLD